jgi:capsular polysaccharide biosynthesis protein
MEGERSSLVPAERTSEPLSAPDRPSGVVPAQGPRRRGRTRTVTFALTLSVLFAVIVGAATYIVSHGLTPDYKSSGEISVTVPGSSGLGQDSILASNDLTAQYVQLLGTTSVLSRPARKLGISVGKLNSQVSAGSVSQQNLLQITAHSSDPAQATRIARTVTEDFIAYVKSTDRAASASYSGSLSSQLSALTARLASVTSQLATATDQTRPLLQSELAILQGNEQTLRNNIAEHQASTDVGIRLVVAAGPASKVSPKPWIYTAVAVIVALFIALQLTLLADRKRRGSAQM